MPERLSDIEASPLGPQSVDARVQAYPGLRSKIETMLDIIENAGGDVEKAAVAEQRVIDAMRDLGHDVLHRWAGRQHEKKEAAFTATPGVNRKEKNALLVHTAWQNRTERDHLHPRPPGAGDSAVFGIGGGGLSGVLGRAATSDHRFWRG